MQTKLKKFLPFLLFFLLICVSILITIAPSFTSANLSRISVEEKIDLPLILDSNKEIALVFFGYSGCVNICTPRLEDIAVFYKTLDDATKQKIEINFLDISTPADKELPDQFAKAFHKDFKGIYLDRANIHAYTKAFKVYYARSLMESSEFDHSTHLYLVTKNGDDKILRIMYIAYPFDFKQIASDIEEFLHAKN
jgi:protein SCO1